jgi:ABC-type branched-subunit amino acid transport system substrate-binding protein
VAQPDVCKNKKGSSSSEIHIYSSEPLEGTSLAQTSTIVDELKTVLDGQKVGAFTIKLISLDDASPAKNGDWDGTVEQSNANKAVNDPDAMAYIGTYNSGAAKLSIPILNAACLVMFSPANSYPGLTKAVTGVTTPGEPDSYYPNGYRNYARDINTDDVQGAASSEWAYSLGKKKAYVIDDGQTYGQGIGRAWAQHFGKIGGTVVSPNGQTEDYDPKATDYNALAQKIKASGADVVFVGAITGQGTAKLWKDIKAGNPDVTMFGPDGVNEKSWFDGAGSAATGTYLTFGGVDISQLTGTGKTWPRGRAGHPQRAYEGRDKRPLRGPAGRHQHGQPRHRHRLLLPRRQWRPEGWSHLQLPHGKHLAARIQGGHHPADPVLIFCRKTEETVPGSAVKACPGLQSRAIRASTQPRDYVTWSNSSRRSSSAWLMA